ncbi:tetratricopeptide repeat protein [Clostridium novyi]|uniref:TPR-repeat-containing protein n=1 Tax=Clostridium novyi (strain NT) TaxID=386415 RepID=A0PXY8_CLONN|nr:tetratricopeptide repeat protein [Clostridium novyi]ABK62127.1 TPR-repeat-containing protein [Clostridium novyi NT]KEH87293.1 hypothetical protein Z966_11800 [Clostridium novyi A str. NCTC 538]
MNKAKKLYEKAMKKYENGYIDEAIDICEEILSLSMKYKPAINLKGLLYYFKGDLKSSSALWKLNYEVNNDNVAKKYLDGLKDDEERFSMYASAIKLMRNGEIDEALKIFIKCKDSDYNRINVDNSIATCYLKLKQYDKSTRYINRVLEIDVKNITANNNKKKLKNRKTKSDNKKSNKKVILIPIIMILVITVIGITLKMYKGNIANMINKFNNKHNNISSNLANTNNKQKNSSESKKNSSQKVDKVKNQENIKTEFKYKELSNAIDSKDFNKIYTLSKPWKDKKDKLNVKDKTLLVKSEDILKDDGVKHFYNTGREYLEANNKVEEAVSNLQKAYDYGSDSYLYGHILFMLGVSYQNKKDISNALKCYEEYEAKYSNENYIQEVLYRTAILYKDVNLNKSKEYAKKLMDNYPDCQYANSKIKDILNK